MSLAARGSMPVHRSLFWFWGCTAAYCNFFFKNPNSAIRFFAAAMIVAAFVALTGTHPCGPCQGTGTWLSCTQKWNWQSNHDYDNARHSALLWFITVWVLSCQRWQLECYRYLPSTNDIYFITPRSPAPKIWRRVGLCVFLKRRITITSNRSY